MPISPAYEWSETDLTVTIRAECRGATSSTRTDIFSSPHYVSANVPPYFLELDLHGAVDGTRSTANVSRGVVTLKLFKAAEGRWGRLLVDLPRADRLKRRAASRALAEEEAQAAVERKKRGEWDDSRFSLGHQMDKDRMGRMRIDEYKAQEADKAASELEQWQANAEAEASGMGLSNSKAPITSKAGRVIYGTANKRLDERRQERETGTRWADKPNPTVEGGLEPPKFADRAQNDGGAKSSKKAASASSKQEKKTKGPQQVADDTPSGIVDITDEVPPLSADLSLQTLNGQIFDEDGDEEEEEQGPPTPPPPPKPPAKKPTDAASTAAAKEAAAKALPPPRATTKITLNFTKQLLTAPARTKTENADYDLPLDPIAIPEIFKGGPAGQVGGDISQRDPAWLKDRGDRYFRMGDVRSAEEAYSLVLQQFAKSIMGQAIDCVTACYSNRAACRIKKNQNLLAADDATQALAIISKARCVTEYPKTEEAQKRCRMRLLARRGAAYGQAGVLHRAVTDFRRAAELADGPMPSDAADKQMLQTDAQRVAERHDEVCALLEKADALLSQVQPAAAAARSAARAGGDADDSSDAPLKEARALYDEALKKAPLEVSALSNRAACNLYLREPWACGDDCTKALGELDAEDHRTNEHKAEFSGMFAATPPTPEQTSLTDAFAKRMETLRFELLRRRAGAKVDQGEAYYPQASQDLKAALKIRPAEPSVVMALDELARQAAAAGVELEPLPPTLPPQGLEYRGDDDEEEEEDEEEKEEEEEEGEAAVAAEGDAASTAVVAASGNGAPAVSKPPVGTRTAAQIKSDADTAFREARLGKAVTMYGKALKADAAAEWMGEGGGILFRCQCLANRSACHLKLGSFGETVDDAGAAIAALGTGLVTGDKRVEADALLLKLLARRGMALCQLTRYDEAAADYTRAVELDPENESLKKDLQLIEAARS